MTNANQQTTISALKQRYDGFLLDAYGVLLDKQQALPGAADLLRDLTQDQVPWLVVTNAASRLPETLSAEFAAFGLEVPAERILTSGSLLADAEVAGPLVGLRALVLGPDESAIYAERAGAQVVTLSDDVEADAIIVADQKGVRWPEHMNQTLSLLMRQLDAGLPPRLLLCNPDLIYPVRSDLPRSLQVGFTAGALAAMIEAVLQAHWPDAGLRFERLGKPSPAIFAAALRQLGASGPISRPVSHPVMLGDQLGTDIAGANAAGIDSVLVGTGLAPTPGSAASDVEPTWHLPSLAQSSETLGAARRG
ncbi:HAD-IIA family hydrolase [Halochromatium sp.]